MQEVVEKVIDDRDADFVEFVLDQVAAREAAEANDAGSTEYVQCDICGEWFRAGNEFRNHLCVTYPDENNLDDEISIVEDYPEA